MAFQWAWNLHYDRKEPAVSYRWTGWVWGIAVEGEDLRRITDHFGRIYSIFLKLILKNRRMSTCNHWLDLQTLGSQPVMPKNLPDHWFIWVPKTMREVCSASILKLPSTLFSSRVSSFLGEVGWPQIVTISDTSRVDQVGQANEL